jgi:hypothetical protein
MRLQTLRLIKHLCNKGAHEFRRAMARHSTNVRWVSCCNRRTALLNACTSHCTVRVSARKWLAEARDIASQPHAAKLRDNASYLPAVLRCRELTHYKGEPDPLKGDVPNQRVRDAAREALDALFGAENGYAPTSTPAQPQLTV